jgi:suppressor of ftsI
MRRPLLGMAVVLAIGLVGCGGGANPALPKAASPDSTASVKSLPLAPEVDAAHSVATVELAVAIDPATGLPAFSYHGEIGVAPTVRVSPGDSIVVDVADELPPGDGMAHDMNLHFHGLTVSPNAPADDVLTMLAKPGRTLHYVVPIPASQEPGLYWYHPHVHGQTDFQIGDAGMSGAIVVQGLERRVPVIQSMREQILIVRDVANSASDAEEIRHNDGAPKGGMSTMAMAALPTSGNAACGPDPAPVHLTVNGAVRPTIAINQGESQFFRVINATGHRNLDLKIDGTPLQIVAVDGYAVDAYAGEPVELTRDDVVVPPAGRVEFVVTSKGPSKLRTLCYDAGPIGDPDPAEVLADLRSGKVGTSSHIAMAVLRRSAQLTPTAAEQIPAPAAHRVVNLSENATEYFINGRAYLPTAAPMFTVRTGTVEEWTVNNQSGEVHDFHLHQVHFYVESVNGQAVAHPIWSDTAVVPVRMRQANGRWNPGSIKVLIDFRNPVIRGTFVFHCHILDHEDGGMMAKIRAI